MLLPRILAPVRAVNSVSTSSARSLTPSNRALEALRTAALAPLSLTFVRHATHQSEGRANGAKDGAGRRLGAKKTAEEWVIPGNILYRQRGTLWHPGENVYMGRDHTLHASVPGYVKYYRDPLKHPKRQYIGVALNRDDSLPYPLNAARKRRLGMLAVQMKPVEGEFGATAANLASADLVLDTKTTPTPKLRDVPRNMRTEGAKVTRQGYAVRQSNWEIGKLMETAGEKVRDFKKGERFLAWRKSKVRIARNIEKRALRKRKK